MTDEAPYVLKSHAHALVAEAYETCAKIADERTPDRPLWKRTTGWAIAQAIRALTPADAIAAREARDKQVRDEALREAKNAVLSITYHDDRDDCLAAEAIEALIEKDKTNE